jgi:hypothetical protein
MATSKKQSTYINEELDWLEYKAKDLRLYVDNNPFSELKDRITYKELKNGGVLPITSATIEQQLSALTKALKEYAEIIKVVNEMREKEENKKLARGGNTVSSLMDKDD